MNDRPIRVAVPSVTDLVTFTFRVLAAQLCVALILMIPIWIVWVAIKVAGG